MTAHDTLQSLILRMGWHLRTPSAYMENPFHPQPDPRLDTDQAAALRDAFDTLRQTQIGHVKETGYVGYSVGWPGLDPDDRENIPRYLGIVAVHAPEEIAQGARDLLIFSWQFHPSWVMRKGIAAWLVWTGLNKPSLMDGALIGAFTTLDYDGLMRSSPANSCVRDAGARALALIGERTPEKVTPDFLPPILGSVSCITGSGTDTTRDTERALQKWDLSKVGDDVLRGIAQDWLTTPIDGGGWWEAAEMLLAAAPTVWRRLVIPNTVWPIILTQRLQHPNVALVEAGMGLLRQAVDIPSLRAAFPPDAKALLKPYTDVAGFHYSVRNKGARLAAVVGKARYVFTRLA